RAGQPYSFLHSASVELDHQILTDIRLGILAPRHAGHAAGGALTLEPGRRDSARQHLLANQRDLGRRFRELDQIASLHPIGWNIHPAAVDENMSVAYQLP